MSDIGEFLSNLTSGMSDKDKANLIGSTVQAGASLIGLNQANKSKKKQEDYLRQIRDLEKGRQRLVNPYASVQNPYRDLQVATKAAEMKAEQTDLALANTLDAIRKTGAGGATALAQAALKSKQGIASSIEKQEVKNQKLQAQGQLQVDLYKAKGQADIMGMQEKREEAKLDRLQGLADIEALRQAGAFSSGVGGLTESLTSAISPFIKPGDSFGGGNVNTMESIDTSFLGDSSPDYGTVNPDAFTVDVAGNTGAITSGADITGGMTAVDLGGN